MEFNEVLIGGLRSEENISIVPGRAKAILREEVYVKTQEGEKGKRYRQLVL